MHSDLEVQTDDGNILSPSSNGDGIDENRSRISEKKTKRAALHQSESDRATSANQVFEGSRASQSPVVRFTSSEAIIEAISRGAADPGVSLERLERLLTFQQQFIEREARTAYFVALAKMQTELPVIAERGGIKDRAGNVMTRYALWEDIVGVITPVLSRHGFGIRFRTGNGDGSVVVTGILSHEAGHWEETSLALPIDSSGAKNAVQAIGSSTSYGKRYTAAALLNLRFGESEDDDGVRGGGPPVITDSQAADIEALIEEVGAKRDALLNYLKVRSVAEIPAAKFSDIIAKLESKRT